MSISSVRTQIVITMAGFGQRFRDAGYDLPKYCIQAHGKTLFHWSLLSLQSFLSAGPPVVFIVRTADRAADFIQKECAALSIANWSLIELDQPTDGQATTAMKAISKLDMSNPFLVYNIDTFVNPNSLSHLHIRGDGWIPCFPGSGDSWSFARADENGLISELREKKRVSPHATIGLYWFKSTALYQNLYERFYDTADRQEAGERYIAPMYNLLIEDGGSVYTHSVPLSSVYPLGTPQDVERFVAQAVPYI